MKINAFPRESVIILDFPENMAQPEEKRVWIKIKWPTNAEEGRIPDLVFEDVPAPTEENPEATTRRATKKSLYMFADAMMRNHVTEIGNLEDVTTGAALADLPADAAPEVFWASVIAFRAGPGAVLEKKKD